MLNLAKVIKVHPDGHSVTIEMMGDGRIISGVSVMSSSASKTSGKSSLPDPNDNEILGVVDFLDREIPVLLGFIFPQIGQCQFKDNRAINRHHSDVYTSITDTGDMEVFHPSGAYIRIAEAGDNDGEHQDLTKLDVDKKWELKKNTDKKVLITLGFVGTQSKIKIAGDGTFSITGNVNVSGDITSAGDVKAGDISLKNHKHGNGNNGADTTKSKP